MTSKTWQLQEAKQRLTEVVHCAEKDGVQHISVHGHDEVVVLEAEDYEHGLPPTQQPGETMYDWFKRSGILRPIGDDLDVDRHPEQPPMRQRPDESILDWLKRSGVWAAGIDVDLDIERDPNDVGRDIDLSD